ncbi:uncharacterized protein LOC106464776 [Limulus polyphemus]|uniref:Uncharacterized protein LOC106464776 n=1 Tax=Limulus polyphemus TaxID=6850 RepID=A0ABM1BEJ8_LIMPO|nr:uncharacterized protein LOC106464776 [Limulus polyphemus]
MYSIPKENIRMKTGVLRNAATQTPRGQCDAENFHSGSLISLENHLTWTVCFNDEEAAVDIISPQVQLGQRYSDIKNTFTDQELAEISTKESGSLHRQRTENGVGFLHNRATLPGLTSNHFKVASSQEECHKPDQLSLDDIHITMLSVEDSSPQQCSAPNLMVEEGDNVYTVCGETVKNTTDLQNEIKNDTNNVNPGVVTSVGPVILYPQSPSLEKKRRWVQAVSESCSLVFFIGFVILSILTPWLCIPSYVIDTKEQTTFQILMFSLVVVSFGLLFVGCIIGNFYWRYEEKSKTWRPILHCGKGPNHNWGWFFSSEPTRLKEGEIV